MPASMTPPRCVHPLLYQILTRSFILHNPTINVPGWDGLIKSGLGDRPIFDARGISLDMTFQVVWANGGQHREETELYEVNKETTRELGSRKTDGSKADDAERVYNYRLPVRPALLSVSD